MKRFLPLLVLLLAISGCTLPTFDNIGSRSKAPFKSPAGSAVLIVEDSSVQGRAALSTGQRAIVLGTYKGSVDDWCKTFCVKDAKGNQEYAVVSAKTAMDKMSPVLQDAFAAYQKSNPPLQLPCILVANKNKGFAAPILPSVNPKDVIAKLETVRK